MKRCSWDGWRPLGVGMLLGIVLLAAGAAGQPLPTVVAAPGPATPIATPAASGHILLTGLVAHPGPVAVADLQRLPVQTVRVHFSAEGAPRDHTFTGVRLWTVLQHAGLVTAPQEKNPSLTRYLVVTGHDGYQVVLSGGELDPAYGNVPALLAWEQDGQPLVGADGPLRLVVPGDREGGRHIYGVVAIDVRSVHEIGTPVATPAR